VFDNPVIGRVEALTHHLELEPPFIRDPHPRVGHQCDIEATALRDAVHLLFDRACIGIDIDVQQMKTPACQSSLISRCHALPRRMR